MTQFKTNNQLLNKYVYPMSNSASGGAEHSEYNLRSAFLNLIHFSAAAKQTDFKVLSGELDEPIQPLSEDVTRSYLLGEKIELGQWMYKYDFTVGPGSGNCNGYFVSSDGIDCMQNNAMHIPSPILTDENVRNYETVRTNLYLCLKYNAQIADDLELRFLTDAEVKSEFEDVYEPMGFNDIGILLGYIEWSGRFKEDGTIEYDDLVANLDDTGMLKPIPKAYPGLFIQNKDITKVLDINSDFGDISTFSEALTKLIQELQVLNVFGGDFYVSDFPTVDSNGKPLVGNQSETYYGGDYRLSLKLNHAVEDLPNVTSLDDIDGDPRFELVDGPQTDDQEQEWETNGKYIKIGDSWYRFDGKQFYNGGLHFIRLNVGGQESILHDLIRFETTHFKVEYEEQEDGTLTLIDSAIPKIEKLELFNTWCKFENLTVADSGKFISPNVYTDVVNTESISFHATVLATEDEYSKDGKIISGELVSPDSVKLKITDSEKGLEVISDQEGVTTTFSAGKVFNAVWN